MDLRKKYELLRRSGFREDKKKNILPDAPLIFTRRLSGDHSVGKFRISDFKKLFPLYLPFFPSLIEHAKEMLFLDLETTSLSHGAGTFPFLIGAGEFEAEEFVIYQYLITSPAQEYDVLRELVSFWNRAKVVITFNGKTFDIPLLKSRYTLYRISGFEDKKQYDLYQLVRGLVKPANLHNVEHALLGIQRDSDLEGKEIPSLYFRYLQEGNLNILKPVIERNFQDVFSLPAILYRWVEIKNPLFFNKK